MGFTAALRFLDLSNPSKFRAGVAEWGVRFYTLVALHLPKLPGGIGKGWNARCISLDDSREANSDVKPLRSCALARDY